MINRLPTADFVPAFGLHRISLVRASEETFRRLVLEALEGTRDACLLGEQFCWHPILPDPAPPPRRAPRPDPLVVCPGFGFNKHAMHVGELLVGKTFPDMLDKTKVSEPCPASRNTEPFCPALRMLANRSLCSPIG